MNMTAKNLPGTGRGTMRSMVEGALALKQGCEWGPAPSVSPADCHLPASGEELR